VSAEQRSINEEHEQDKRKAGNAAIRDPNFGQKMQSVLKEVGAEAAYFTTVEGQRDGYIIVNL
jgi:hypothetical protein